jgi:hypothetical protein
MGIQSFSPAVKELLSDRPQLLTVCTNHRSAIAPKNVAGAMRLSRLSLDFQSKRDAWGRDSIRNCRRPPHRRDTEKNLPKITWTYVLILARYREVLSCIAMQLAAYAELANP